MSTIVEGSNSSIDPESEVRKLQELVKTLERQNQVLRSKQGQSVNKTPDHTVSAQTANNAKITPPQDGPVASPVQMNVLRSANSSNNSFRDLNVTLEDVELIDIDKSLAEEDEEKWLFDSPKKIPPEKCVSPYKWARQEFENPSPDHDVQTARKSLIFKLDEVAKGPSRSPSIGTLSSPGTHSSPPSRCDDTPEINGGMPSIKKPLSTPLSSQINTRTFTRPKKRKEPEVIQPASSDGYSTGDTEDSLDGRPLALGQSPISRVAVMPADTVTDDSHDTLKYNGVTDVKTLARMQEESLRKSIGSARKSGIRGPRAKVPSLGVHHHENSPSSHSSPRSSPARYDSDGYQGMRRSNNSLASASSHSSSPPDSPYGSQYIEPRPEQTRTRSEIHRGSLPNLNRSTNLSLPRNSSFPKNPVNEGSGSRTGLVRPRIHGSPVQRTASPGRTLSPLRSGIPTPRGSGIPRPGSASKLPTARKSSIPSRGRPVRNMDESWKEGCY